MEGRGPLARGTQVQSSSQGVVSGGRVRRALLMEVYIPAGLEEQVVSESSASGWSRGIHPRKGARGARGQGASQGVLRTCRTSTVGTLSLSSEMLLCVAILLYKVRRWKL